MDQTSCAYSKAGAATLTSGKTHSETRRVQSREGHPAGMGGDLLVRKTGGECVCAYDRPSNTWSQRDFRGDGEDVSKPYTHTQKHKTRQNCQNEPSRGTGNHTKTDHKLASIHSWWGFLGEERAAVVCWESPGPPSTGWLPHHRSGPRRDRLNLGQEQTSHGSPANGSLVGNRVTPQLH